MIHGHEVAVPLGGVSLFCHCGTGEGVGGAGGGHPRWVSNGRKWVKEGESRWHSDFRLLRGGAAGWGAGTRTPPPTPRPSHLSKAGNAGSKLTVLGPPGRAGL